MAEEKALAKIESNKLIVFDDEERQLIKKTFAPGLSDLEFKLFVYTAEAVGLNPLKRQIYAVVRKVWNPETNSYEKRMTIQTGIDGFRAVSARNKNTIPGKEPTFTYRTVDYGKQTAKTKGNPAGLDSATAYLKVFGKDGAYHEVSSTAYWEEYVPLKKDGTPQAMWSKMPRIMLAKCAEALLHRRCNPEDLSGIYTSDEMAQADNEVININPEEVQIKAIAGSDERAIKSVDLIANEEEPREAFIETDEGEATDKQPQIQTELEGDPVETTEGPGIQGRLMQNFGMEKAIQTVKKEFPGSKVVRAKRQGKFGFLDAVGELKEALGQDELYYEILSTIGAGQYKHASEINDRTEQEAFWKALKKTLKIQGG